MQITNHAQVNIVLKYMYIYQYCHAMNPDMGIFYKQFLFYIYLWYCGLYIFWWIKRFTIFVVLWIIQDCFWNISCVKNVSIGFDEISRQLSLTTGAFTIHLTTRMMDKYIRNNLIFTKIHFISQIYFKDIN